MEAEAALQSFEREARREQGCSCKLLQQSSEAGQRQQKTVPANARSMVFSTARSLRRSCITQDTILPLSLVSII